MKKMLILNNRKLRYFIIIGISLYIFICVLHFTSGRPLWLDENFILNNLKELKPHQIFGPLKHSQGFPRFYLFIIQKISSGFNYNMFILRLPSLLLMLSGFFIWLCIYRREETVGIGFLLFILSWCGSHSMSYYSAELKQYAADVFVAAVFALIILKQRIYLKLNSIKPSLIIVYMLIPVLVLFCYTGYFFVLLPAYNLLLSTRFSKKNWIYLCIYLLSVFLFSYISYNLDLKYTLAESGLRHYWKDYFISTTSFYGFIKSFGEGIRNIFVRWFIEEKGIRQIMTIFFPFALCSMIFSGSKQIREDRGLILSLKTITPFLLIVLFIAGVLKTYPFTGARVTLFICPFIFYVIIKGIEVFRERFFLIYATLATIYTLTLLSITTYLLYTYLSLWLS